MDWRGARSQVLPFLILAYAWSWLVKLGENAALGWTQSQIAAYFGITNSPTLEQVFTWSVPLLLAGLSLWLFEYFYLRRHAINKNLVEQAKPASMAEANAMHAISRVAVLDLFKEAERCGLRFMEDGDDILEFVNGLRQAGSDGTLTFWGRDRRAGDPLIPIPTDHWHEFSIEWEAIFIIGPPSGQVKGFRADNFPVGSRTLDHRKAYFDLHVDAKAFEWITQEKIPLRDAARIAYQQTQGRYDTHWLVAAANADGKSEEQVLDMFAKHLGMTSATLSGVRPLMDKAEVIPRAVLQSEQTEFRNDDLYDVDGEIPQYKKVRISRFALKQAIAELNAGSSPGGVITQQTDEESELKLGYDRATFRSRPTRENALLRLSQLRSEGVGIRNDAARMLYTAHLDAWSRKVDDWMHEVIEALKPVSETDSEWFTTLDTVPGARVPIPNVRLGGTTDREMLASIFRQHDYRLSRLDKLLQKYGVGVGV